jgi:acetylglutamate kinase
VVAVLAGRNNTALVAAIGAAGGHAVGLTGADDRIGLSEKAPAFTSVAGDEVDLGLVGQPVKTGTGLLTDLLRLGYVPVIASLGVEPAGALLNVNADTFAGHLAGALGAGRLIIAGGTPGVLDGEGRTIDALGEDDVLGMIASGTAHSGMIAKLAACRQALSAGVTRVAIVSGRGGIDYAQAPGTRIERAGCRA